jgi:hypothetical protein
LTLQAGTCTLKLSHLSGPYGYMDEVRFSPVTSKAMLATAGAVGAAGVAK